MTKKITIILVGLISSLAFAQNSEPNKSISKCSDGLYQQESSLNLLKEKSKDLREAMIGVKWLPDDYVIDYSLRSRALIIEIEEDLRDIKKCEKENLDSNCGKLLYENCRLIKISENYFSHTLDVLNQSKKDKCVSDSSCYSFFMEKSSTFSMENLTK